VVKSPAIANLQNVSGNHTDTLEYTYYMTNEPLIKYISEYVKISDLDIELLTHFFKYERFSKSTVLEKENTIAQKLYFIKSGFIRTFYNENEEEITTQIVGNNNFITGFNSFVTGTPSQDNVKCITECEVFYISKTDYDFLTQKSSTWGVFCKKIYEKAISFNLQRTNDLLTLSAEKRYLKLMFDQPEVIQNVPIQYIASYIGIKSESLSRIRKKIIS